MKSKVIVIWEVNGKLAQAQAQAQAQSEKIH